jgi:hypothetical protein
VSFFKHRHYWRPKTALNTIHAPDAGSRPTGGLIIEDCRCGAVRTIEFYPDQAPKVRMAAPPEESKP